MPQSIAKKLDLVREAGIGPSRHLLRRSDMSAIGGEAEVAGGYFTHRSAHCAGGGNCNGAERAAAAPRGAAGSFPNAMSRDLVAIGAKAEVTRTSNFGRD
jgi:hypothetical protein